MNKKFLICLAPLLVTAAFVVMPAVSQGFESCVAPNCPHAYKNGSISAEGAKLRGIAWGTLQLHNEKLGEVECHNVFAGYGENPVGGGAAKGKVQAFFPYECKDATCETSLGEIKVEAGKMPWQGEAVQQKPGEFWGKTGFKGPTPNVEPPTPEFVQVHINCTTITQSNFFGENDALTLNNGIAIGSAPAEVQVFQHAENPIASDLETPAIGAGETKKKLKGEGYGGEELLEVKNP
jgi:hypothetical protein